jgi:hypothetical protein
MTSSAASLRPYCSVCGNRFAEGQLKANSKFCEYCGDALSPFILQCIANVFSSSTPPVTPARNQQDELETPKDIFEPNESPTHNIATRGTGRGKGRGRGKFVPRYEYRPITPPGTVQQEELGRGLRTTERPDYNLENYYRAALGKSKPDKANNETLMVNIQNNND